MIAEKKVRYNAILRDAAELTDVLIMSWLSQTWRKVPCGVSGYILCDFIFRNFVVLITKPVCTQQWFLLTWTGRLKYNRFGSHSRVGPKTFKFGLIAKSNESIIYTNILYVIVKSFLFTYGLFQTPSQMLSVYSFSVKIFRPFYIEKCLTNCLPSEGSGPACRHAQSGRFTHLSLYGYPSNPCILGTIQKASNRHAQICKLVLVLPQHRMSVDHFLKVLLYL